MSRNLSDSKQERDLLNRIAKLEQQVRESRTVQVQGTDAIQIGYTEPSVLHINSTATPWTGGPYNSNWGSIGTFVSVLEYDEPQADDIVFGELDIGVSKNGSALDAFNTLSIYYEGMFYEEFNDLYHVNYFKQEADYRPVFKVLRIFVQPDASPKDYYIHTRWRYIGVGKNLQSATSNTLILPS